MSAFSEFDVYVPLVSNSGSKYPARLIVAYKREILRQFGGITDFKHRSEGEWRMGPVSFRDRIVLWRVLCGDARKGRAFFRRLKLRMQHELGQQAILIVERRVSMLH